MELLERQTHKIWINQIKSKKKSNLKKLFSCQRDFKIQKRDCAPFLRHIRNNYRQKSSLCQVSEDNQTYSSLKIRSVNDKVWNHNIGNENSQTLYEYVTTNKKLTWTKEYANYQQIPLQSVTKYFEKTN